MQRDRIVVLPRICDVFGEGSRFSESLDGYRVREVAFRSYSTTERVLLLKMKKEICPVPSMSARKGGAFMAASGAWSMGCNEIVHLFLQFTS